MYSSSNSIYGPSKFRVFYLIGKQPRAAANGLIKFLSKRSSSYMCMLLLYILRRQRHYANFKFSSLCCCLAFDVDTIHFNKLFPAPFYLKIQNLFSLISHSFFFVRPTRFSKLLEKEKSFLKSLTCHPWKLMFLHEYCRPESFFILMYQSFWQKLITKAKSTFLKLHWKNPARCRLLSFEHIDFKLCMNT